MDKYKYGAVKIEDRRKLRLKNLNDKKFSGEYPNNLTNNEKI